MSMTDILYTIEDKLYVNLTNKCPCRCTFCIRQNGDGVGSAENLWFEHEPSLEQVMEAFSKTDLRQYKELIFCGYGEPTCALDNLLAVCRYIRGVSQIPIRLNTNGLSDLMHHQATAPLLTGLVDSVSISLNAPDPVKYTEVTRPSFGEPAFQAMLDFAEACKKAVPQVMFSVVDVISPEDILACRRLAQSMGIPLRVRKYSA